MRAVCAHRLHTLPRHNDINTVAISNDQGFIQDFLSGGGGGGGGGIIALKLGGSGGMLPQENYNLRDCF